MPCRILVALFVGYIALAPARGSLGGKDVQALKSGLLQAPAGRLPVKIDPGM